MLTNNKDTTILIADDQPENQQVIINILKNTPLKYNFINVPNGKILVEVAQKRMPDLIITDWDMPEMGGLEATKLLKANPETAEIPIIVCTGVMGGSLNLKMALDVGAVDFIRKPIDSIELLARVQSMLRLSTTYQNLAESHKTIARQHNNILSSVRYALKIQTAILPTQSSMQKSLPDFFIFYKPRDIVSGDFYWFNETAPTPIYENKILTGFKESKRILAVVDCTGHGVPGAFMTLIANTLLNQIINEKDIHEPATILYELDKALNETLRSYQEPSEDSVRITDGMDLSIMAIGDGELTWAGAKHPLIYFQNNEMLEIRGSKFPMGGLIYKQKTFEQHVIPYQKGDIFYMFTDGYIDQLSPDRVRFMSKRLKELLQTIHTRDLPTQKTLLENTHDAWRGEERQVDDILVLGFRM